MIYAIVDAKAGWLASVTRDASKVAEAKVLSERGYIVIERPDEEAGPGKVWSADDRRFVDKAPDPPGEAETLVADVADLKARVAALEAAGGTVRAR
jgi:hypothetical protein